MEVEVEEVVVVEEEVVVEVVVEEEEVVVEDQEVVEEEEELASCPFPILKPPPATKLWRVTRISIAWRQRCQ